MTINELIKKYEEKINHYEEKYSDTAVINFSEIAEWKAYQEILQDLKQLKPTTICGYTIEEIITILNALELERILDIKITMDNLGILANKLQEDFNNTLKINFERQIKSFGIGDNND